MEFSRVVILFFVFPYLFLDHRNPNFVCSDRFVFTSSCTTYHYLSWVVLPDGDVTDIFGAIEGLVWPGPSGIGMLNDSYELRRDMLKTRYLVYWQDYCHTSLCCVVYVHVYVLFFLTQLMQLLPSEQRLHFRGVSCRAKSSLCRQRLTGADPGFFQEGVHSSLALLQHQ